jgi:hypothetical protein
MRVVLVLLREKKKLKAETLLLISNKVEVVVLQLQSNSMRCQIIQIKLLDRQKRN